MPEINWLAVFVAALASFLLGGIWYSKALFGKAWQRETGLTDEALARGNMAKIFGLSFVLAFLAAWNFANFLGPRPSVVFGTRSSSHTSTETSHVSPSHWKPLTASGA